MSTFEFRVNIFHPTILLLFKLPDIISYGHFFFRIINGNFFPFVAKMNGIFCNFALR